MDLSLLKGTRIIALDIETTDLSIQKAYVRELGAAEYVDGVYVRGSSALFSGGKCGPGAVAVHGITDEMVKDKPQFVKLAGHFCTFVNDGGHGRPADIIGHNVSKYDLPIISKWIKETDHKLKGNGTDGRIRVIDTCLLARRHFQFPSNKLKDLCEIFGIQHGKHRALGDAMCTWELFLKMIQMNGWKDLSKVYEIA